MEGEGEGDRNVRLHYGYWLKVFEERLLGRGFCLVMLW